MNQRRGRYNSAWSSPNTRRFFRPMARINRGAGRGRNPLDENGNVSRCAVCDSVNHWACSCPDAQYYTESDTKEPLDTNYHQITLFQSNLVTDDHMKTFVSEAFSAAVLDSGAPATVAGKVWMKCYIDGLPASQQEMIVYSETSNSFKFGSGSVFPSIYKVKVPAVIGGKEVFIESDVVDTHIPMLLSKAAMKKANTNINFKDDTVYMLGQKLNILLTSSGHYAVPLGNSKQILNDLDANGKQVSVTLHIEDESMDKRKIALKLHSQFSHPPVSRLLQLINNAGMGNDAELIRELHDTTESCTICKEYKRAPARPAVGLPLVTEFNEVVVMDLKMFQGKLILHLIDHLTRFSAAAVVNSKRAEDIISKIFQIWISVFGPPLKFFSDNGGEFNNEQFRSMCEAYNITIKTTAAESPWSNGMCERHNAVLEEMLLKTLAEKRCSLDMALHWVVHAKNSLANVHGFAPYQLAMGYTPQLPSVLHDKPPAFESASDSELVNRHLNAMAAARKAFIEAESSQRIKRALKHNIRPSSHNKYFVGDSVYYKRNDSKKWKGPGRVIGHDSQQILVKHGGTYVRVHPCRVLMDKRESNAQLGSSVATSLKDSSSSTEPIEQAIKDSQTQLLKEDGSKMLPKSDISSSEDEADIHSGIRSLLEEKSVQGETENQLKANMDIRYRMEEDDNWHQATVLGRAGKATGKYGKWWNLCDVATGRKEAVDFGKVSEWSRVAAEDGNFLGTTAINNTEILVCQAYSMQVEQEVLEAKRKELQNWSNDEVYEEVNDDGQTTMSVRWVITPKFLDGIWRTKARLVARGYEENQELIRTDSPTCMRESLRIVISIIACMNWKVHSIDIKAAFLQGKAIDRQVFLKPPTEAAAAGKLWRLKKVVYGLSDASRVWYLRVADELLKLGVSVSKYDKALFYWKTNNVLNGILVVHVDDFLWAGDVAFMEKVIIPLKSIFKISKEEEEIFRYVGVNIWQANKRITLDQKSYMKTILPIKLPTAIQRCKRDAVSDNERVLFRALVGQLNWASCISRPDISYETCELSTVQSRPLVTDVLRANKVVKDITSSTVLLHYVPLDISTLRLRVYTDASHNSLVNGGSQEGHVIFLCDRDQKCVPISWASKRIKRVARSTLSAETLAAVDAVDAAFLIATIFGEILNLNLPMSIDLVTDCKSLLDAVNTTNLVSDRRLRVDIAALRQMVEKGEVNFHWIDSSMQLADGLTKKGASKARLLEVIERNYF